MDDEPLWLTSEDVAAIHTKELEAFGGLPGIKDAGLVESAIENPKTLFYYGGENDVLTLAVRLCWAIGKNHGFNDGNKRTATAAMIMFLAMNGYDLIIPDDDPNNPLLAEWVERLVSGDYTQEQFADRLYHFIT